MERDEGMVRIGMEVVGQTLCDQPKGPGAGMPGAGRCSAATLWPERALGYTGHT